MSQQNDDFISFEKALRDLKMQSEELKKLVSEGEIRAFRDGDSMKFRREDLDSLRSGAADVEEEELIFAEALEDDAGMQTEELSDEDTLLADDDDDFVDEPASGRGGVAARPSTSRVRPAVEEETKEPTWVIAAALVSAILLLYGFMVAYKVAQETPPSGLTGMWAPKG